MNRAVIAVGSNIDPDTHIRRAEEFMKVEQRLIRTSSFITTKPLGYSEQADFTNGAFLIETESGLDELTTWLKGIEKRLGRVRTGNKWGPRTIDLDVVAWNGAVIDNDFYERSFVKNAVLELVPDLKY